MGYCTEYTLNIESNLSEIGSNKISEIESEIEDLDVFDPCGNAKWGWSCYGKWYSHTEDMCLISKKFPEVLFALNGCGDDHGDIWNEYYLGGKYQYCPAIITLEEFDPSKLRECVI